MSECQTKAGNLECMNVWMFWTTFVFMSMLKTYSHTFSLSLSLFLTLTLFQSLIQSFSTCWTSFVFISMLKSRCLYVGRKVCRIALFVWCSYILILSDKLYPDVCFALPKASRPQIVMTEGRSSGSSLHHQLPHALGGRIIGTTLPRDWTCRTYSAGHLG